MQTLKSFFKNTTYESGKKSTFAEKNRYKHKNTKSVILALFVNKRNSVDYQLWSIQISS